jgi:hypothetical protein
VIRSRSTTLDDTSALFAAWSAWIGSLMVGSVVVLLLDKSEWRVAVGMLSLVIGSFAFIYSRRT